MRTVNTNGLLRQFFSKGRDLSVYTVEDLHRAERVLDSRPRRVFNWKTPGAAFDAGLS